MSDCRRIDAVIVLPDGTIDVRKIAANPDLFRRIVGGWLQGIGPTTDRGYGPWFAYVNEDGKWNQLPVNETATALLTELGWQGALAGDYIVGTCIIVGEARGEDVDVPRAVTLAAR